VASGNQESSLAPFSFLFHPFDIIKDEKGQKKDRQRRALDALSKRILRRDPFLAITFSDLSTPLVPLTFLNLILLMEHVPFFCPLLLSSAFFCFLLLLTK
jgi:hypothetical protein